MEARIILISEITDLVAFENDDYLYYYSISDLDFPPVKGNVVEFDIEENRDGDVRIKNVKEKKEKNWLSWWRDRR